MRSAAAELFGLGQPVRAVVALAVEGAPLVALGQGADGAVALGPGGPLVGSEEADFGALVRRGRVVGVGVDGEGGRGGGGGGGGGVAGCGYGCCCGGAWEEESEE